MCIRSTLNVEASCRYLVPVGSVNESRNSDARKAATHTGLVFTRPDRTEAPTPLRYDNSSRKSNASPATLSTGRRYSCTQRKEGFRLTELHPCRVRNSPWRKSAPMRLQTEETDSLCPLPPQLFPAHDELTHIPLGNSARAYRCCAPIAITSAVGACVISERKRT